MEKQELKEAIFNELEPTVSTIDPGFRLKESIGFYFKIIEQKISLGIDIGSYDILSEYSKEIKSRNFAFLIGLDFLKSSFSVKNEYFKSIRNNTIKKINSNGFIKSVFFDIANKGFRF